MGNFWAYDYGTKKELEANPVGIVVSHECWLDQHFDCYDADLACHCWCHRKYGYAAKQKLKHAKPQEAEARLD